MNRLAASPALLVTVLLGAAGCGLVTVPSDGAAPAAAGASPAVRSVAARPVTSVTGRPAGAGPYVGALGGYGCPNTSRVRFTERGWYSDGISGFFGVRAGGWDKQGCDGRFAAMPMSGSGTRPDPGNYALWTFRTTPVIVGNCQVAAYVPDDHSVVHVGGDPARYQVYDAAAGSGTPVGSFTIDELTTLGTWVSAGTYPVTAGVLTVKLTSAGQDWHGTVVTHAHLPLSQVMAFCGAQKTAA
jgi:translation initiation factor IF-2